MFGMSFAEIMIILVIAVLFLGPDKLPSTMVKMAKFFKSFKSGINDAKSSFEQEIKIQELKEETLEYKKKLDSVKSSIKKSITFDELDEIRESTSNISNSLNDMKNSIVEPTTQKSLKENK